MDFGDAPDAAATPRFPTLLANDGARHLIVSGFHLGRPLAPDAEGDGQPNATATGDDSAGVDDENGVIFDTPLIPAATATVTVNASLAGRLDAFIDFNADGDWADAGEQVFRNTPLSAGDNRLSFALPSTAVLGAHTLARFRFSSAGNLGPDGAAADGEVEDYQVTIANPPLDFGDAPASYPTLLADDGARHVLVEGVFLGARADAETNGQPEAVAVGDDNATSDDEDGIVFVGSLIPGRETDLVATVSIAGRLARSWRAHSHGRPAPAG